MSLADVIASFVYILGAMTGRSMACPDFMCYFTAVLSQYFQMATFFWCARRRRRVRSRVPT